MTRRSIVERLEDLILCYFSFFLFFFFYYRGSAMRVFRYLGAFLWVLFNILKYRKKFYRYLIPYNPLNKFILFFLIAALISTIFSLNKTLSFGMLKEYIGYYIFFFLMGCYLGSSIRNVYFLLGVFIYGGIIFGSGRIWDALILRFSTHQLFSSFLENSGYVFDFAKYLVLYLSLLAAIFLLVKKKLFRATAFIGFLLIFICSLLNTSRAAWISVLISLLAAALFKSRRTVLYLVALTVIFSFLISDQNSRLNRLNHIYKPSIIFDINKWDSRGIRALMLEVGIKAFRERTIFGAGPGESMEFFYSPRYRFASVQGDVNPKFRYANLHNLYLEIALELGIVGLLAFLLIFWNFFWLAIKRIKVYSEDTRAIISSLICMVLANLVLGFADSNLLKGINYATAFWFLFGVSAALLVPEEQGGVVL